MLVFKSKTLYTPAEKIDRALIFVEDGKIVKLGPADSLQSAPTDRLTDFGECVLAPGFLDIHIHGAAGQDVMQAHPSGLREIEVFLARHGVTGYYPTTVTASLELTLTALERLANAIENGRSGSSQAQPLGIHLEGPFLSHARRGVHPPQDLRPPTVHGFDRLWQAARGHIRLLTIAPELEGSEEVIAEAAKRGVCVSLGHSDADLDSTRKAVRAGARHATHTFNAMRPLDHRQPGILGEVLTNPRLTADVIADGVHVDPTVVAILLRAKGAENIVLITDAISATGMPDGRYRLGSLEVELKHGRCLADGKMAGSVLTMDLAVRNIMKFAQWDLQWSLRAATLNAAKVAGTSNKGVLQPGADADMVVLTPTGELQATILGGKVVQ